MIKTEARCYQDIASRPPSIQVKSLEIGGFRYVPFRLTARCGLKRSLTNMVHEFFFEEEDYLTEDSGI